MMKKNIRSLICVSLLLCAGYSQLSAKNDVDLSDLIDCCLAICKDCKLEDCCCLCNAAQEVCRNCKLEDCCCLCKAAASCAQDVCKNCNAENCCCLCKNLWACGKGIFTCLKECLASCCGSPASAASSALQSSGQAVQAVVHQGEQTAVITGHAVMHGASAAASVTAQGFQDVARVEMAVDRAALDVVKRTAQTTLHVGQAVLEHPHHDEHHRRFGLHSHHHGFRSNLPVRLMLDAAYIATPAPAPVPMVMEMEGAPVIVTQPQYQMNASNCMCASCTAQRQTLAQVTVLKYQPMQQQSTLLLAAPTSQEVSQ